MTLLTEHAVRQIVADGARVNEFAALPPNRYRLVLSEPTPTASDHGDQHHAHHQAIDIEAVEKLSEKRLIDGAGDLSEGWMIANHGGERTEPRRRNGAQPPVDPGIVRGVLECVARSVPGATVAKGFGTTWVRRCSRNVA